MKMKGHLFTEEEAEALIIMIRCRTIHPKPKSELDKIQEKI
jgi:hypothetical protein